MRGGIVAKFNLQFPCDADVDIVRKVINFPESPPTGKVDETTKQKLVQAGAASALALDSANRQDSAETDSRA